MLVLDLEKLLERPKQEQCHRQENSPKSDRFLSKFPELHIQASSQRSLRDTSYRTDSWPLPSCYLR
jgi:hypothetical protein